MPDEEGHYRRAIHRIYRGLWFFGAAGAVAAAAFAGLNWALAFLLGAIGACFSFSWLHQTVNALGPGSKPPSKLVVVFAAGRYLLLAVGGYVIVKVFGMNAIGALAGLFVPIASVIFEVFYELVHERA
jgi:hypothetical protein